MVPAGGPTLPTREEAVVLLQGRPSLLIRQNRFEIPRSGVWAELLTSHREIVEARLPSVGRLEVDDGAGFRHAGTGWVIAEGIIATNRHVAEIFARKEGRGGRFLANFMGAGYRARIDFREEYQEQTAAEVTVEEVVFMEDTPRSLPDVALLRLASHGDLPDPIPLLQAPLRERANIAIIGYPAFDPRYGLDATEAAKTIFGTIYDVKRLSPGCIMGRKRPTGSSPTMRRLWAATPALWCWTWRRGTRPGCTSRAISARRTMPSRLPPCSTWRRRIRSASCPESRCSRRPRRADAGEEELEEAPPASYAGREGYDEDFLGAVIPVPMPQIADINAADVLTFQDPTGGEQATVLKYTHFSVVMNSARRMCFFSAVNIDGKQSVAIKGKRPSWRVDPASPSSIR